MLAELFSYLGVNNSSFLSLLDSALGSLRLLLLNFGIFSFFGIEVDAIVISVPLSEGSSVDLHDAVFD